MARLAPFVKQQFFDANGDPLSGGKIFTYVAGTSTPLATYTDQTEETENPNPIELDSNGEASIWLSNAFYKFVITDADGVVIDTKDQVTIAAADVTAEATEARDAAVAAQEAAEQAAAAAEQAAEHAAENALPAGGLDGAALVKATDDDRDVKWEDLRYSGISQLTNQAFSSAGLKDTLDKIIRITYSAPQVSLSASGSGTIREKGTAVTAVALTATITKRSDPIAEVRFYKGVTLIHTVSSPNPNGGTETYNWTGSFSDNESFSVQVDDNGDTGGPSTSSASQNFVFVYPYLFGAGAPGLSASAVGGLSKHNIASANSVARSFTPTDGQVFYFAYPASYGALVSILDVNNFETFPDWTLRTENITGLDGNPISHRIYEFNNPVVAGSYQYTFKRS